MLSGILQLLFNAVDIIVVGRFTGSQALAAVGSTTALINVFTNLFIGVSLGANVLAARFYASGQEKKMSETVHTAITFALTSGIVMVFVGLFFSRTALELMDTPADVIEQSALYMRIYFAGMPFFMLYNYGAAILRAVGDTKRPLFFLDDCGRNKCIAEYVFSHRSASWSCRSRDCDRNRTDDFLYVSASVSLQVRQQLSIQIFKDGIEMDLFKADFSGRNSGRNPKYGDQFFECPFAILCKFIRFCGNGWIYCCQQYFWIFVCIRKFHHTGLYELYQSELQCWKVETNG